MRPIVIEKLSKLFTAFPGIGQRQSARLAYWLADADKSFVNSLGMALKEITNLKRCSSCFKIQPKTTNCSICENNLRDSSQIAVVEKDTDLEAMEKTGLYAGHYHILGGLLSVIDSKSRDRLRIKELFNRAKENKNVKEIILALSATPEGEFTSRYIEKILEPVSEKQAIKISRLGRGLSSGLEVEYLNEETLKNALENRK